METNLKFKSNLNEFCDHFWENGTNMKFFQVVRSPAMAPVGAGPSPSQILRVVKPGGSPSPQGVKPGTKAILITKPPTAAGGPAQQK